MDGAAEERAAQVHRRFKRALMDAAGRSFWENWTVESSSFLVGMSLAVVILCLEPALWLDDWPPTQFRILFSDSAALSMLPFLLLNGWLLDRFLASKTPREVSLPRWILALRLLAASVPLLGLHVISLWQEFLMRRSCDSLESAPAGHHLNLLQDHQQLPRGLHARQFYRSGFFFVWLAIGFLPLLIWAGWLANTRLLNSRREAMIVIACAILHLAACAFMAQYVRSLLRDSRATGWRRTLLRAAPFLWPFSIPGLVMGLLVLIFLDPPEQSLSWHAYARRTGASRVPLWRNLQGALRQRWQAIPWFAQWRRPVGLSNPDLAGQSDENILALYRLKTLSLTLDGAALLAGFHLLAARFPGCTAALNGILQWATYASVALLGVGLLIQGTGLAARLFRVSGLADGLSRHPTGRYLLLTQVAFLAGTQGAFLLTGGQVEPFGALLCLGSALCAVSAVLFFLPKAATRDLILWGFLFLSLSALGGLVVLDPSLAGRSLAILDGLTVLAPVWSLGLALALGGWLFRPFSWRHALDRSLPCRLRAVLGLVLVTAALPLGGLAIPFWIHARRRIWPRYERLLQA
jgi:hypothetical protein